MAEDLDPITVMGMEYGCGYCAAKTDNFYFIEYYALPRKLVRKWHREKELQLLVCKSCYEANIILVISINNRPFPVFKDGCRDMNRLKCAICRNMILHEEIKGVITSTHMISGSAIENKPLVFLCSRCMETHLLDF